MFVVCPWCYLSGLYLVLARSSLKCRKTSLSYLKDYFIIFKLVDICNLLSVQYRLVSDTNLFWGLLHGHIIFLNSIYFK